MPIDQAMTAKTADEDLPLSPVYSLAVQHQSLWLLSGTESGVINLHSVRHDEGKRICSLYQHTSAVSVMSLSSDERSLLSGSWDKTIADWDLNTGQVTRSFTGSGGQISAIELRPFSTVPVPRDVSTQVPMPNGTLSSNSTLPEKKRGSLSSNPKEVQQPGEDDDLHSPSNNSLFGDSNSLFGDNDNGGGSAGAFGQDDDDEFSRAIADGLQQQRQFEANGELELGQDTSDEKQTNEEGVAPAVESLTNPLTNGNESQDGASLPHAAEEPHPMIYQTNEEPELPSSSESTFLDAAMDGTLRIWDRRQPSAISRIVPSRNVPPWCTHACWSPDGNFIYAGRRNGTVEEYSIHKGLREPNRTLKFPTGSGAVSAVHAMPNGRHLIWSVDLPLSIRACRDTNCDSASFDILRLYDLHDDESNRRSPTPFLIVPGHRTGVVSQLYVDPTCTFMISTGGNRGWEGSSTEVLLGYEIEVR